MSISNPAANIAPNPAYFAESTTSPCWQVTNGVFVPAPSTPQCIAAEVQATDAARADEGIGPIQLPSNFATLTQPEQLFVLADLERVSRGLAPIVGLSATLSASAQSAAAAGADPTLGAGVTGYSWWGSTWAGGVLNALDANYTWMYQDGWGGSGPTYNLACTSPTAPGCWGHRDIILTTTPGTLVMGAGYAPDSGFASLTELIVAFQATATPPLSYTWSEAEAAGAAA